MRTFLIALVSLLLSGSAFATRLFELTTLDKDYLMIHFKDGEVIRRDDGTGNCAFMGHCHHPDGSRAVYDGEALDLDLAIQTGSWRILSADDPDYAVSRRAPCNDAGYFWTIQNVQRTIVAHAVSNDPADKAFFLDALILEADWSLGRNPTNMIQMTTASTALADKRSVEFAYTSGYNDGTPGLHPGHTPYWNMHDWRPAMIMGHPSWLASHGHPAQDQWPQAELFFNTDYVWAHTEFTPQQTLRGKNALYGYLYGVFLNK